MREVRRPLRPWMSTARFWFPTLDQFPMTMTELRALPPYRAEVNKDICMNIHELRQLAVRRHNVSWTDRTKMNT